MADSEKVSRNIEKKKNGNRRKNWKISLLVDKGVTMIPIMCSPKTMTIKAEIMGNKKVNSKIVANHPSLNKDSNVAQFHINKQKRKGGYYDYYLTEFFLQDGKQKKKIVASLGRNLPLFYKPNILKGYCEDLIRTIPPASVDLIIDDPPYGSTHLPWDEVPDWDILADLYYSVLKDNGLVYIFGKQPSLIEVYNSFSELFDFRFEVIWNRNNVPWTSHFKPLIVHENIFVFCKKGTRIENTKFYSKNIMTIGKPYSRKRNKNHPATQNSFGNELYRAVKAGKRYPKSVIEIPPIIKNSEYPTQKPLDLIRWIIRASSQRNDVVLDPHCGSGTTLLAAMGLSRKSIGIELHQKAYDIALKRIQGAIEKLPKNYIIEESN